MGSSSTSGIIIFSIIVLVVLIAAYFISSSGKNLNLLKASLSVTANLVTNTGPPNKN